MMLTGSSLQAGALPEPILRLKQLPVFCNALLPDSTAALAAPRGDLELCYSPQTGYLWNQSFDPALVAYNPTYENSLHYSPRFAAFAAQLADRLIARYNLAGKRIVEIGCGEGNFLAQLCEGGHNTGIGYDPSYDPARSKVATSAAMQIETAHYPTDRPIDADLVVCQHVLEHLSDPTGLLTSVRKSLESNGERGSAVYFEVPDATYMVEQLAVWDLIYEHVSYFSAPTMRLLFESCGFQVTEIGRSFGDQYLYVEAIARPLDSEQAHPDVTQLTKLTELIATFGEHVQRLVADWNRDLSDMVAAGRVAVWGAGSKGVTFLNLLDAGRDVSHVIDVNPNKAGLHLPGTGHRITSPDSLVGSNVKTVLVMNPLYVPEVQDTLAALGLGPDVVSVG